MSIPQNKRLVRHGLSLLLLLAALLAAPCRTAAQDCAQGETLRLNGMTFVDTANANTSEVLTVHSNASGKVALRVVPNSPDAPQARLLLLPSTCDGAASGPEPLWVHESPIETTIGVSEATTLRFRVVSEDRRRQLDGFSVRTVFSEDPARMIVGKDVDEEEDEVVAGFTACTGDDLPTCARPIALGEVISGEVGFHSEDPEDFFLLHLDALETVEIHVAGDEPMGAALYDEAGQELLDWTTCSAPCDAPQVRTLGPGDFLIAVRERFATGASYSLGIETVSLP